MNEIKIGLLLIQSENMDRSVAFYSAFGMDGIKHSHPPCGEHYSATVGECVFEIYPKKASQPITNVLFGLNVRNVEKAVQVALDKGGTLKHPIKDSEWGKMATVFDPDGNSVMLIESANS